MLDKRTSTNDRARCLQTFSQAGFFLDVVYGFACAGFIILFSGFPTTQHALGGAIRGRLLCSESMLDL